MQTGLNVQSGRTAGLVHIAAADAEENAASDISEDSVPLAAQEAEANHSMVYAICVILALLAAGGTMVIIRRKKNKQ